MTLRVGVAGVHGHGRGHLDHALALQERGIVDVVAVADPRGAGEELHGVTGYADAEAMIQEERLDVAVFSTPIPTHAPLTLAALAAGAHVLLEKPPVVTVVDHHAVVDAARRAERRVQVGFQSLASDGIVATTDALESGVIGDLRHIGAVGVWSRSEEYWRRAPWAGHRHRVLEAVVTGPEPTEISSRGWTRRTVEGGHFRIVDGIADLAERAAWDARLFRELDVDW